MPGAASVAGSAVAGTPPRGSSTPLECRTTRGGAYGSSAISSSCRCSVAPRPSATQQGAQPQLAPRQIEHTAGSRDQAGLRILGPADLQAAQSAHRHAAEAQDGDETGPLNRLLADAVYAPDPQPGQALPLQLLSHTEQHGPKQALPSVGGHRHAVPDVGLTARRPDLQPELPDPLRLGRKPAVGDDARPQPCSEAAAPPRQPPGDQVALLAHRSRDRCRRCRHDLAKFDREPNWRRTRCAQVRRPQRASRQNRKKRPRIFSITSGSPVAAPPGKRPKTVRTKSEGVYRKTASQPLKSLSSGRDDHCPSLTVARHLPPQGPETSIP